MNLVRYYHTLRYLRPVQFYGRMARALPQRAVTARAVPAMRPRVADFALPPLRSPRMLGPRRFRFLNQEGSLDVAADWNAAAREKLWLYHLHYFDDLVARGRDSRRQWHVDLMQRWVRENAPGHGNGWEPYPVSMRIVNWVKWSAAGHELPAAAVESLAVQARFLARRLEYHLLGNHLWANGKALVFAGALFEGDEADGWRDAGLAITRAQLREQVLADGGHFERSPMYHALFVEDLLDLLALSRCYPVLIAAADAARFGDAVRAMLGWLDQMTHPDGELSFFNDAATDVALRARALHELADGLQVDAPVDLAGSTAPLEDSGYRRVERGDFVLLADVGQIGPDHLPGHAHADTLSCELSWRGQRVLCNSGTSCYGTGAQRQWERGTGAHNTVTLDELDSSEVWHGFRVARRARPLELRWEETAERCTIECAHDGYTRLAGRPVHRRRWDLSDDRLGIADAVEGAGSHRVTARFHLHPLVEVERESAQSFRLRVPEAGTLLLRVDGPITTRQAEGSFAWEFGERTPRPIVEWSHRGALPVRASVTIEEA
jgi:uncharacterized heparinase superfamily protein